MPGERGRPPGDAVITAGHGQGEPWWCECSDARGPHVHCPWGGMHVHLIDPATGQARDA